MLIIVYGIPLVSHPIADLFMLLGACPMSFCALWRYGWMGEIGDDSIISANFNLKAGLHTPNHTIPIITSSGSNLLLNRIIKVIVALDNLT